MEFPGYWSWHTVYAYGEYQRSLGIAAENLKNYIDEQILMFILNEAQRQQPIPS